jgi:hypothetical protein
MPYIDKLIRTIELSNWSDPLIDAAYAAGIIAGVGIGVFLLILATPTDELALIIGTILQAVGYGSAVIDVVNNIYQFADFTIRVKNAQSEQALKEAGDIFARVVVGIGIDLLLSILDKIGNIIEGKSARRIAITKNLEETFDKTTIQNLKKKFSLEDLALLSDDTPEVRSVLQKHPEYIEAHLYLRKGGYVDPKVLVKELVLVQNRETL